MVAWNQPLECPKNEGLDRATMVQRGSFQGLAECRRDLHGEENLCAHTMIVQELCKYINNNCTKIPVTVKNEVAIPSNSMKLESAAISRSVAITY